MRAKSLSSVAVFRVVRGLALILTIFFVLSFDIE
jgi:hypothetical protein